MFVQSISKVKVCMLALLVVTGTLSGCQSTPQAIAQRCANAAVPTLDGNECLVPQWISFAQRSQRADESWRGIVVSNMNDGSMRSQLARAVALGWSSKPVRMREALSLYGKVNGAIPVTLAPLVSLWQKDLKQRLAMQSALGNAKNQTSYRQTNQIMQLERSNAELKHKLAEMVNIEASMERHHEATR